MRIVRTVAVLFAVATCLLAWSLLDRSEKLAHKAGAEQVERAVSAAETDINRSLVGLDMFLADMARWTQHMPASLSGQGSSRSSGNFPALGDVNSLNLLMRAALNQNLLLKDVALVAASGEVLLSAEASTARLGLELPPGFLESVVTQPFPALLVSAPVAHTRTLTTVLYLGRSVHLGGSNHVAMVAEVHGPLLSSMLDSGTADTALEVTFERGNGQLLASSPVADVRGDALLSPELDQLDADGTARVAKGRLKAYDVLLAVRPTLYPGLSVSASLPMNHVLTDWYKDRAVILVVSATLLLLATVATLATQRSMQRVAQA
jgi:hypothetical protein